ncbi:alpha/beta fold hydrolase [Mumia zhuanghuii]|uniref:Alpha/beta fold hydrolase n=2 Tax=Mumia TaxID=1546255 RepID=A0ABW1QJL7_9ACTN|nr:MULTISPECIES: alpha/beta fold hydrolase [Mumia]KAA1419810.1 alpha/beta fold hydrolase [Mumia zhuanghuii]
MHTDSTRPHVVIAAAMGVHSAYYRELAAALEAIGWSACTLAARGIDRDTEAPSRRNDWGYAQLVAALDEHASRIRSQHPGIPVVVLGHSLGGQAALGYALTGGQVDGLVLAGASEPYYRRYGKRFWGIWALAAAVPPVTALYGYWPAWGFGGPQPRTLMREWSRLVRRRRFPYPAGRLPREVLDIPTFVLQVEGDQLSVPRAARALVRPVKDDAVTWWDYHRDAAPEGARIDHLSWAKSPGPAVDALQEWWSRRRTGADAG